MAKHSLTNRKISPLSFKRFCVLVGRDLKLAFSSPLVYVVVFSYLILGGVIAFNTILKLGYLDFRAYFQISPYLMMLISLVLSSGQLVRRRGTLDIAALLPVSLPERVGAKFVSGLVVITLPLVFAHTIPLSISLAGWASPDFGAFFAGTLGLFFLGSAFFALGLAVSSLMASQTVAFLVSLVVAFLLWIPNQLVPFAPVATRELLLNLSFLYHMQWFGQGLLTVGDTAYFVAMTLLGLAVAGFGLTARRYAGRLPVRRVLNLGAVVAGAVLAVLILSRVEVRADLTRDGLFTLDSSTRSVVTKLDQDLNVVFFCDDAIPLRLKPYKREVVRLLKQYAGLSGHFRYRVVSPSTDEEGARLAKSYGVGPIEMKRVSSTARNIHRVHFGMALAYGEKVEVIPEVVGAIKNRTLEYQLTFRVKRILSTPKKIYFSTGHKESADPLSPDGHKGFKRLFDALKEYSFATHNPDTGPIPPDAALFVLAGPKRGLSTKGQAHIDALIDSGRPVLFLLDGMKFKWKKFVKGVPMQWVPNDTGINDWIKKYGFTVNDDMVLSMRAPRVRTSPREVRTYALIPMINFNRKMDIFPYTLSSLARVKGTPWRLRKVVRSDEGSWRHVKAFEENLNWPMTPLRGSFEVGYYLTRGADKPTGRIFVFGDSDLFRDRFLGNSSTNVLFARHVFNLLLGDTALEHLRFKGRAVEWLKVKKGQSTSLVQAAAIAVPVVLLLLFGLSFTFLRRRKMRHGGKKKSV